MAFNCKAATTARFCSLALALTYALASPSRVAAQVPQQLWTAATIDWLKTERLTYELEVENKTNPETLEVTPAIFYTAVAWADLLAQVDFKSQVDAGTTPVLRFGVQLHILSRLLQAQSDRDQDHEKPPRRRIVVSTLLRVEKDGSTWRLRHRFELSYPFNRRRTTDDGAIFWTGDNEQFIPFDRAPGDALVSNERIRTGFGYRQNFAWRYQALYVWNGTRHAGSGPLVPQNWAISLKVLRQF
jgi:hypothetical protein